MVGSHREGRLHEHPIWPGQIVTVAARPNPKKPDKMEIVIFDALVFGAGSSPTIWGRYAAWLGRSCTAILPNVGVQIYVDDPAFVLRGGTQEEAGRNLTILLLWFAVMGFPVKLSSKPSTGWVQRSNWTTTSAASGSPSQPRRLQRSKRAPNSF